MSLLVLSSVMTVTLWMEMAVMLTVRLGTTTTVLPHPPIEILSPIYVLTSAQVATSLTQLLSPALSVSTLVAPATMPLTAQAAYRVPTVI